jgi:hypothetical protein
VGSLYSIGFNDRFGRQRLKLLRNNTSIMLNQLKRLVPAQVKRSAREALLERRLSRALRRVRQLPEGQFPDRELLHELQLGWGNDGFAARYDFLEEVIERAAVTQGPILECGSGLTTLLLGLYAGRRGVKTWSLEHIPEWHARVTAALRRYRIPGVDLCLAPLREYREFDWYDPPLSTLPENFSLVVCDGPPGTTRGGRYGLLPVLGARFGADALILMDDADREGETDVLKRWASEKKINVTLRPAPTGTFALVTC